MPVGANATEFPIWNVTVNDTAPLWFYCRQHAPDGSAHCGAGMVFSVNAVSSSNKSFSAFQSLAQQLNGTGSTGGSAGNTGTNGARSSVVASSLFSLGALVAAAAVLL